MNSDLLLNCLSLTRRLCFLPPCSHHGDCARTVCCFFCFCGGMISECYSCGSHNTQSALPAAHQQWGLDSESGSSSDTDRPDPDLLLDDLASRRFHSPSPAPPTNFAVPISPSAGGRVARGKKGPWPRVTVTPSSTPQQKVTVDRSDTQLQCDDVPVC